MYVCMQIITTKNKLFMTLFNLWIGFYLIEA